MTPTEPRPAEPAADEPELITIAGQRLKVRVRQGSRRVPLVVCNGIGAGLEALDGLVDAIDPEVTVVRFDVPGVGGSPAPALPYNFPQTAHLMDRLMFHFGHSQYDALGYSWGGVAVQQLALQHPRSVRRIILLCSNTGAITIPGRADAMATLMTPQQLMDSPYKFAGRMFGGAAGDPELLTDEVQRSLTAASERGYQYQLLAAGTWTSLPFLWAVHQPTLVLAGDDDPVIPVANARMIGRLIPKSTVHVFQGGHLDPLIRPTSVADQINDFLG